MSLTLSYYHNPVEISIANIRGRNYKIEIFPSLEPGQKTGLFAFETEYTPVHQGYKGENFVKKEIEKKGKMR